MYVDTYNSLVEWCRCGTVSTHSCIFPWKAEEGVGSVPVSHVLQDWQKLHCMIRLRGKHNRTMERSIHAWKSTFKDKWTFSRRNSPSKSCITWCEMWLVQVQTDHHALTIRLSAAEKKIKSKKIFYLPSWVTQILVLTIFHYLLYNYWSTFWINLPDSLYEVIKKQQCACTSLPTYRVLLCSK